MEQAYLSLGSNLGDRLGNLRRAVEAMGKFAEVFAVSDVYETEPMEYTAQPWFANAALALEWNDEPQRLLEHLMEIEHEMGRQRGGAGYIPKGPRVIDLDIVLYGDKVIRTPRLTVPHPAMHERRFVLEPLVEIAAEVEHPLLHKTVRELLRALPPERGQVRKLGPLNAVR